VDQGHGEQQLAATPVDADLDPYPSAAGGHLKAQRSRLKIPGIRTSRPMAARPAALDDDEDERGRDACAGAAVELTPTAARAMPTLPWTLQLPRAVSVTGF
jgi:hypothetical protein